MAFVAASILPFSSCSDFLDREPITKPEAGNFLTGAIQVENYINGLYMTLPSFSKFGLGVRSEEKNSDNIIAEKYGNVPEVEVVKPVSDINELYANSKCFLHISRAEGLSYALLEAVYAGLPVICSNISENKFAEKFPTVEMVESENVTDIAEKMKCVISKNTYSKDMIEKSRKIIDEEYSIACWVKNMLKQYGE